MNASAQSIPELELRYLNEGKFDERANLFTLDGFSSLPGGIAARGREGVRAEGRDNPFLEALDEAHHEISAIYVDGNVTVLEGFYRAVHRHPLSLPVVGEIAPTGLPIAVPYAIVYELADGLIRAKRSYFDWNDFAVPVESTG